MTLQRELQATPSIASLWFGYAAATAVQYWPLAGWKPGEFLNCGLAYGDRAV